MATSGITGYINSTTDPITTSNYNEVDALVFSELSYSRFEDMGVTPSDNYSISQYAEMVLEKQPNLPEDQKDFMNALANSPRYQNCTLENMQAENTESQWAAMTINFHDGSNSSVIAMRGTDASAHGWHESFELLYDQDGTRAQELSRDYLNGCNSEHIYMTGHSKGGNDCITAYIMSDKSVRDRVVHIDNYDGPGLNDSLRDAHMDGYKELDGKVDNYYPKDSIIGHLLNNNPGNNHYIDAEVRPDYADKWVFGEHDPFAFSVDGKTFKPAEQSELSKFADELLDKSVDDLSYEDRENLIRFLDKYGLFHAIAGKDTVFSHTDEATKEALEKMDFLNIVPDKWEEGLTDIIAPIVNVIIAVEIFRHMSPGEKDAVFNTIRSIITHLAEKAGEEIAKEVEKIKDRIVNKYEEFADWLSDKYNKTKETIRDINRGIKEKINEVQQKWNDVKDYINKKISDIVTGPGGSATGIFTVSPPRMYQIQQQIMTISEQLQGYENELDSILAGLPAIGLPAVMVKKIKDGTDNFFSVSLQSKCKKYGNKLEEIIRLYERTEKDITKLLK